MGRNSTAEVLFCEGNAAKMMAALILTCVLLVATLTTAANPPLNVIEGDGPPVALNIPAGKGIRYSGPIVYTNEKPPIIYFPPPPKDAKPGFGGYGKKSKSIKYVPMPHHDLPVLIYTSDKTPPIHVVHPPTGGGGHSSPPPSPGFGPPKNEYRSMQGSLASAYKGLFSEQTAPRIVTSTYEIPSTSYGTPMSPMDTFSISSSASDEIIHQSSGKPHSSFSFGLPSHHISHGPSRPFRGPPSPPRKSPPHILYSGHTPIHMYDEPEMFVQAPGEIPLKSYEELPPKASFGPAKPAFGYQTVKTLSPSLSYPPPRPSSFSQSFGVPAPYRTISTYTPPRDNLIRSSSVQNPSIVSPPNSLNVPKPESLSSSNYGGSQLHGGRLPTYSLSSPQKLFSFGPVSIEYGPPTAATEPFVSFSEPTGSLQSFYGSMADVKPTPSEDGWIPGPPPSDVGAQITDSSAEYNAPPHSPPPIAHHGPPQTAGPIHNSIFRPHSQPHGHGHGQGPPKPPHPLAYGGSKIASLLSSFKLKRNKPKFALAPKSMHKPPIIIYYGKKPPVHVYQKPDEEYEPETVISTSSSSNSQISVSSSGEDALSSGNIIKNDNRNNNGIIRATSIEHIDLTYGGSQKNEIRVAPPAPSLSIPEEQQTSLIPEESISRPAIIPAKPVDIFPQTNLEPSIYMARNSLNTIFVTDMNGSGAGAIKTYIVRDQQEPTPAKLAMESMTTQQEEEGNIGSIISTIAQDRISGEPDLISSSSPQAAPISEDIQVEEQEAAEGNTGDALEANSSNDIPPTILVVSPQQKEEIIEQQQKQQNQQRENDEQVVEAAENVQVQVIQSPSSFQTSLSNAEKEAEEKSTSETS